MYQTITNFWAKKLPWLLHSAVILSGILYLPQLTRAEEEGIDIERIVVTPSRIKEDIQETGQKVDLITREDIELSSANDLAELLTDFTSVNISSYGGVGANKNIRMRGSSSAQVLVMIDGRPINNPRDGQVDFSSIPLDNIERVELVHGPSSSLYGSQAMGGTVNIITKQPPEGEKPKTELLSSFGTFETYSETLLHGAKINDFSYLVSGAYQSSQGSRDNSEFNAKDFNVKLKYAISDRQKIAFNSGFYKNKSGAPGPITSPDTDDKQNKKSDYLDLGWNFQYDAKTEASARIYNNYDRLDFIENTAGSFWDTANSRAVHTTQARGINLQGSRFLTNNCRLIGGLDYIANFNNSTSSSKHRYNVKAGFLESQLKFFERLNLNLSVRVDDYSNFGTTVNPGLTFSTDITETIRCHGLFARSFRAPTFNDLYWPDEGWAKGNPNLVPEKGLTGEFGIKTEINKYFTFDITYYRNAFSDLINWAQAGSIWQPSNVNSALIDGIEFENSITFFENLLINLGYSYMSAIDNKRHKYLIYQPKQKLDFSIRLKETGDYLIEFKGQYTGVRFHDASNNIKVKPFLTLGFNASKKFSNGLTFFVSMDNLIGKKYQVIKDYPVPGFSLTSGLKLEF